MFGFKTRKRLRTEILSMRREYDRLNALLIRRTSELVKQEKKAMEVQADAQKFIDRAFEQDGEIKRLAQIIIQASLGKSQEVLKAAAARLLLKFPQLGPPAQEDAPSPDA